MNQIKIGKFISLKRKEKNLTQEQLAERLSISHKTVSKWECGKCMPDYSIIEMLCNELNISVSELLQGETSLTPHNACDETVLERLREIDELKASKISNNGIFCILIGLIAYLLSTTQNHAHYQFVILTVLSVVSMSIGLLTLTWGYICKRKIKINKK